MGTTVDIGNAIAPPPPRRRRLALAVALLLLAAVAAVALVLATGSSSPPAAVATGSVVSAATVQRRDLVARDTESGTLSYAHPQTVYDRLSGTITWLPGVGAVVKRGQRLFEVDDRPVILMYGSRPAYRELDPAARHGPDVRELNANLVALGYGSYGIVVDNAWQTATTDAVKAWQASLGERQTGKIALGRVVFLPGEQLVNAIDGGVGATTSFEGAASPRTMLVDLSSTVTATSTPSAEPTPATPPVRASSPTTTASTTTSTTTAGVGMQTGSTPTVTETVTVTVSSSASPSGGKAGSGKGSGSGGSGTGGAAAGTAILQTSSRRLVATVDLPPSVQSEARLGAHVSVEMPDGSIVAGTIRSVSPIASSSGGGQGAPGGASRGGAGEGPGEGGAAGSTATVPVIITLHRHINGAGLDQAPVSVKFASEKAKHVLSVPVTALLATSGHTYALQEAQAPHALLAVRTGLFAAGYVQISGPGIHPGLKVTDSQG